MTARVKALVTASPPTTSPPTTSPPMISTPGLVHGGQQARGVAQKFPIGLSCSVQATRIQPKLVCLVAPWSVHGRYISMQCHGHNLTRMQTRGISAMPGKHSEPPGKRSGMRYGVLHPNGKSAVQGRAEVGGRRSELPGNRCAVCPEQTGSPLTAVAVEGPRLLHLELSARLAGGGVDLAWGRWREGSHR